jgi:hypothetical protein
MISEDNNNENKMNFVDNIHGTLEANINLETSL